MYQIRHHLCICNRNTGMPGGATHVRYSYHSKGRKVDLSKLSTRYPTRPRESSFKYVRYTRTSIIYFNRTSGLFLGSCVLEFLPVGARSRRSKGRHRPRAAGRTCCRTTPPRTWSTCFRVSVVDVVITTYVCTVDSLSNSTQHVLRIGFRLTFHVFSEFAAT